MTDNINMVFLGALSDEKLSSEAKEGLEGIDILFVPVGGDGVLDPAVAHKLAVQFEPKIIIPSHFGDVGEKDALKKFLKDLVLVQINYQTIKDCVVILPTILLV